MTIPEYKTTTIEKQRFVVSHYGLARSVWDWLILIVSFYVAIVVPYNATFGEQKQQGSVASAAPSGPGNESSSGEQEAEMMMLLLASAECQIGWVDISVEIVFIIDVILNFRTTFVNRKGEVVTSPKVSQVQGGAARSLPLYSLPSRQA